MAAKLLIATVVCIGSFLMGCDSVRVEYKGHTTTEGLPGFSGGGPESWWGIVVSLARLGHAPEPIRASAVDILFIIPNGVDDERRSAGKPKIEGQLRNDWIEYLTGLSNVSAKIEKLNRLQAGCSSLTVIGPFDQLPEFSQQSFEAVMKLGKEFMLESEPVDLFSLMPQNSVKAVERWTFKRTAFDNDALQKSQAEFRDWMQQGKLTYDPEHRLFFNGILVPQWMKKYPNSEEGKMPFPVNVTYVAKTETFDKDLLDAVNEDWEKVPKQDQSVARKAFLTYFLSKPEASKFKEGGRPLLEDALKGAFDVCAQMTSPASTDLDEHGFRYASVLAAEMFKTLTVTAACDE